MSLKDSRCPPGHRLLIQCIEQKTEAEARAWITKTFGEAKGKTALLVPGVCLPDHPIYWKNPWKWRDYGFRAYLPIH